MSDRLAVMAGGLVEQVGTPAEVYDSPSTAYVADFLGSANILDVEIVGPASEGRTSVRLGGVTVQCGNRPPEVGADVRLVVRPERLSLEDPGEASARIPATVARVVYQGPTTDVIVRLATGEELVARQPSERVGQRAPGEEVTVYCREDALRLLPPGALAP